MSNRTRFMCACRWVVLATMSLVLAGTAGAQYVREPAPGILLVAGDGMADPRFEHAVVLLIQHDASGSWGLIINKPTTVSLGDVLPAVQQTHDTPNVYFGGPVQIDHLSFLYRDGGDENDPGTGLPGVRWSASEKGLEKRLSQDQSAKLRVYAGYAGWAPGQLLFEIHHGGWKMIQGRGDNVFSDNPEALWQHLTDALGGIAI